MKFWNKLVTAILALALALSLSNGTANAASKKKKKKEVKKEEKHERHETRMASAKTVIEGANVAGKPGYFFADTATALNKGQVMASAHLTFDSWGSALQIPVGVSYGIAENLMINVNTAFYSYGADYGNASGLSFFDFGGKYSFKTKTKNLDIAAGLDFAVGPLSNGPPGGIFGFDPYGVVTYTFVDGFQLNGKLGLYVQAYDGFSYSFFQCDLGAAYPLDKNLTGIAELATNGVVNGALGGTPLLVGIRTGKDVQLQAFGGLDLGGEVGVFVGGGVALVSM